MRHMTILAAAIALAIAPIGLSANPGKGNGNGNGHANGNAHGNQNGNHSPNANAVRGNLGCPPGLAWREPACVPPGQARQGVTTADWVGPITTNYVVGDILGVDDFITIEDIDKLGLPALLPGEQYAVIDGTLVKLDSENYEILQLIRAVTAVFD